MIRFPKQLPESDEGQVWKRKKDEDRFDTARAGDTLIAPFQCDFCWFINLKGRVFDGRRTNDRMNLCLIRRVNLDMFWSRETSTVVGMYRLFEQTVVSAKHLGIVPEMLKRDKKWPVDDKVGFGEAMLVLWQSLQKGKNVSSNQQFDSVRKIRGLATNMRSARVDPVYEGVSFKDGGKSFGLTRCGTSSVLFIKFMQGCEKRMGRVLRQDVGLSVPLLLCILDNLNVEYAEANTSQTRKRDIVMLGAVLVSGFCGAFRGNEIFLVESSYLCRYKDKGRDHRVPHIVIPLMGRFKGETGERNVLKPLVLTTKSGIQVGLWVDRLIKVLEAERKNDSGSPGPAFCDQKGFVLAYSVVNGWFHEELLKIQQAHSGLLSNDIDVVESFNIYRSLRRGATSRATALNYSETIINLNNRWRQTQSNKGKGGLTKMSQLYVEISLALDGLLEFSASL